MSKAGILMTLFLFFLVGGRLFLWIIPPHNEAGADIQKAGSDPATADSQADEVNIQIEKLFREAHTESLKALITQNARMLRSKDCFDREQAVLFFHDLKARALLSALLQSDQEDDRNHIVDSCLDAFTIEDIPVLYRAALKYSPGDYLRSGSPAYHGWINKLARATSEILRIPHEPVKSYNHNGLRAWWVKSIESPSISEQQQLKVHSILAEIKKQ